MVPKYINLKEKINNNILEGIYPIGSKLPTENELAKEYEVSRSTVRQALELLASEGIISKRWGSGNTVISKSDSSKKKIILVLLPNLKSSTAVEYIDVLNGTLLKEGFRLEYRETQNRFSVERTILQEMLTDIYAGLIVLPALSGKPSVNRDLFQALLKRQIPIIFLESAPESLYNASVLSLDAYNRGYLMARYFINMGKKNLGGIFLQDSHSSLMSFSGFTDAIRDANLPILDDCFMWVNSVDAVGVSSRASGTINKFLKAAYNKAEVVYSDDSDLSSEGTYPIFTSALTPSKNPGQEAAKLFLALKKNGNSSSVTIPYKQ